MYSLQRDRKLFSMKIVVRFLNVVFFCYPLETVMINSLFFLRRRRRIMKIWEKLRSSNRLTETLKIFAHLATSFFKINYSRTSLFTRMDILQAAYEKKIRFFINFHIENSLDLSPKLIQYPYDNKKYGRVEFRMDAAASVLHSGRSFACESMQKRTVKWMISDNSWN